MAADGGRPVDMELRKVNIVEILIQLYYKCFKRNVALLCVLSLTVPNFVICNGERGISKLSVNDISITDNFNFNIKSAFYLTYY